MTAPMTAIKVPDRALDVGLPLAWVAPALDVGLPLAWVAPALAFGEGDRVGVIEVKVVGNLIPRTLLPEVAISRLF